MRTCMDEGIGMGERRWVVIGFTFSCVEEEGEEGGGGMLGGGSCEGTDCVVVVVEAFWSDDCVDSSEAVDVEVVDNVESAAVAASSSGSFGSGNVSSPSSLTNFNAAFLYIYNVPHQPPFLFLHPKEKRTLSICFFKFLTPLSRQ